MTRGSILRRLGTAYLWCLFVPLGTVVGALGASRALVALARYDDSIELRAARLGARSVLVISLVSIGLMPFDPTLSLAVAILAIATGDAATIEFANAIRTWRTLGPDTVRTRWLRAQIAIGTATATMLVGSVAAAATVGRGALNVGDTALAATGAIGAGLVVATIATRFVALFLLQSAHVATRDVSRHAALEVTRWDRRHAAITEPPAST